MTCSGSVFLMRAAATRKVQCQHGDLTEPLHAVWQSAHRNLALSMMHCLAKCASYVSDVS